MSELTTKTITELREGFRGGDVSAREIAEAFNVANGDVIVWSTFFERLAEYFGMPLGAPTALRVADDMPNE